MKARALALKIALLIEEHSETEIEAAVSSLRKFGSTSALLEFLSGYQVKGEQKARRREGKGVEPVHRTASLDLSQLQESDPERYSLLRKFERLLREQVALKSFEELKRFGAAVSKEFRPRKSRKESISPLLEAIVHRPIVEIEEMMRAAVSSESRDDSEEYQRLARFLIEGKSTFSSGG
jgi:hypothetical protein